MKIKYLGRRQPDGALVGDSVEVGDFGRHLRGEVRDYPDEAGRELLATSHKQQFAVIEEPGQEAQKGPTAVAEAQAIAEAAPGPETPTATATGPETGKKGGKPKGKAKE